ncbi:putative acetyltransferase [Escherichia coli]|uniref:Putative acetyltransferase n=1 Tax=Escherichia coli TaxID=562 RepID=A0A377BZE0_ECOLX|nr:putative acetyltransferase [Escherichia coli]
MPQWLTLGDPALYSRFGFELAAHHDLRCRWPGTEKRLPGTSFSG